MYGSGFRFVLYNGSFKEHIMKHLYFSHATCQMAPSLPPDSVRIPGPGLPVPDGSITAELLLFFALSALAVCLFTIVRQHRALVRARRCSSERLRLLRNLLDLCYTYRESPAVFLDKFKDRVHARELESYRLTERSKSEHSGLNESEKLLCRLLDAGFTHRELCVVFDLKKASHLYTKHARIRKKKEVPSARFRPLRSLKKGL